MLDFLKADKTYIYLYRTPDGKIASGTIRAKSLKNAQDKFWSMPLNKEYTKLGVSLKVEETNGK